MKKTILLLFIIVIGVSLSYWNFQNNMKSTKSTNTENIKEVDHPEEFTKYFKDITTKFNEDNDNYPINYRLKEYTVAKNRAKKYKNSNKSFTVNWQQRGPANVGGRTRGLIIDPDDSNNDTWFAGSATGGIWKTTDGGQTWTCLTDMLVNLSVNTLAMAASDHNIIYAGTGESFPGGTYLKGSGIFKSTDKGQNWTHLSNTSTKDFEYVNRLIIDPTDENIVLAATEAGILKSTDGGTSWTKVYGSSTGIEDLDADPSNFNNIYATENSATGVIKSIDAGDTWTLSNNGLEQGTRYELAISDIDPTKLYLSINNDDSPWAYRSIDSGANWEKFNDASSASIDFLGGQGDYDNTIAVHPYNSDVVFLGGVNLWKIDYASPGTTNTLSSELVSASFNTGDFMDFVNFGATYWFGKMEIGTENYATDITESDFVSVEIRFGPGKTQKAHRYTVGGQGSGVAPSGYYYEDYVDVPFEVWDVTNDRQLMASFRDQEEDGNFDLEARSDSDPSVGREYLFVNLVDYDPVNPNSEMTVDGGHSYKQMYFYWPILAENGTWDENNLPESKIYVKIFPINEIDGTSYVVTDAYGNGDNNYDQGAGFGETVIPGVHPDHHNLVMIKTDEANEKFTIVNANDGGLAISENEGEIFNQLPNNYITTQFYGVAKCPDADEYFGGMQDNGTWASPDGVIADETTDYIFHIGGDGFECSWNVNDANKMIGSVYYNSFQRSVNRGASWASATNGIEYISQQQKYDGPFISRISSSPYSPDVLFAVGYNGIYKSTDYAANWEKTEIETNWNSENYVANKYVTSQHNVEVSLANEKIVWAGAAMDNDNDWSIFVSTDQGESYNAVNDFTDADLSGYVSGIATHPFEDSTAYLLFSLAEEPKIIRTTDLGQTWEDISGFVGNTSSDNGFPDVVTHCLIVLPNDPNTLWAGTDIGLFESNDNGANWHYADNGIPAVSVYDMFVQDGQVIVATHGRGIWTASIDELNYVPEISATYEGQQTINSNVYIAETVDSFKFYVNNELYLTELSPVNGNNSIDVYVTEEGTYNLKSVVYNNSVNYESRIAKTNVSFTPEINIRRVDGTNDIDISSTFSENYDSVQVYLNDNLYNTVSTPPLNNNVFTVSVTESGSYTLYIVCYIGENGYTSNSKSLNLNYVGLGDVIEKSSLKVYPNPTSGFITVDKDLNNYQLDVFTLNGSKVHSEYCYSSDKQINLQHLKNGTYIVRITKDNKSYTQKIQVRK